jgi:hypothetical protein
MNYYNIYFKGKKINNRPLNDEELKNVKEQKEIYKHNNITNSLEKISTNDIYAVKTIII